MIACNVVSAASCLHTKASRVWMTQAAKAVHCTGATQLLHKDSCKGKIFIRWLLHASDMQEQSAEIANMYSLLSFVLNSELIRKHD